MTVNDAGTPSKVTLYDFEVSHPELGTVVLANIGPGGAVAEALKRWGVPFREYAGYCDTRKLGKHRPAACKRCAAKMSPRAEGADGGVLAVVYCANCLRKMEALERDKARFARETGRDRRRPGYAGR